MVEIGMDADLVRGFATKLDHQAAALLAVITSVNGIVSGLPHIWAGPDAEEFVGWWSNQHRPALQRAHDSVAGLATSARNNAHAQDVTSGVAPGTAGVTVGASAAAVGASAVAGSAVASGHGSQPISPPTSAPRGPESQAEINSSLAWYEQHMQDKSANQYHMLCESAVEIATGHPHGLGYITAHDHFVAVQALPNNSPYALHPPSVPAPRGAIVYFNWTGSVDGVTQNWGHVGLSEGGGQFIGTDGNNDSIGIVSLQSKGSSYLGWSWPTP